MIPMMPDSSVSYVFFFSLMWPLLLLFLFWFFIQWYRCCWARYFMRRDQLKSATQEKGFDERWKNLTESEKVTYDFEKHRALHLENMEKLAKSIENHRYFLETLSRRGYWNWNRN
jgi:hypothetical protein